MIYFTDCGVVYELSRTQYKKLLREIAKGNPYNIGNYGKQLGHTTNVVDLTADQASERLHKMGAS
jgi:hypothetical protein